MKKWTLLCLLFSVAVFGSENARTELKNVYDLYCRAASDINEHIPVLCELSRECSSVVEIGVREMNSIWGILQGLAESPSPNRKYIGIDLSYPSAGVFTLAERLSRENDILFQFIKGNDMMIDIEPTDLLFIDSLHTYLHLTYELEKFSPKVRKYIAMHDTIAPWGEMDETSYLPEAESKYPKEISRNKRGLWPAVVDFLHHHPEWELKERRLNNHGFTVLQRASGQ